MTKITYPISSFLLLVMILSAGCATTRARKAEPVPDPNAQITQLQQQVQAKDQEIQDLQSQLKTEPTGSNYVSGSGNSDKSSIIRVTGVSVADVQQALVRAGYDPGPVDGRAGKKTKSAIKKFQRRHNIAADGIVGEKTWERLK